MAFNIDLARKDGATDAQIAEHLAKQSGFNIDLARKDGATDAQIADHLAKGYSPKTDDTAIKAPPVDVKAAPTENVKPDTSWMRPEAIYRDMPLSAAKGVVDTSRAFVKGVGVDQPAAESIPQLVARQLQKYAGDKTLAEAGIAIPTNAAALGSLSVDIARYIANKFGFTPTEEDSLKGISEYLQSAKSKDTQALEAYQATNPDDPLLKRIGDKAGFMLSNPSTIGNLAAESIGPMGEAGLFARLLKPTGKSLGTRLAAGEGATAGFATAQAIRDQQEGNPLSPGQQVAVAVDAVLTSLFTKAGGAVANRLGIGDIDEIFAREAAGQISEGVAKQEIKSRVSAAVKSAAVEAGIEEMPQSMVDTISLNIATGRPAFEGVPESAVEGLLTAAPIGATAGAYQQHKINQGITGAKLYEELKTEKETQQEKQLKINEKIDTQGMSAEEKRNYKLEQAGKPVPKTAAELEAEQYVTGVNAAATGAGTNLSGQPDTSQSDTGAGATDGSAVDGAGESTGTVKTGTLPQSTALNQVEQTIVEAAQQAGTTFKAPAHARNWVTKNIFKGDKEAAAKLEKSNPGIYKRLTEQSKVTPVQVEEVKEVEEIKQPSTAFNEAELQEAELQDVETLDQPETIAKTEELQQEAPSEEAEVSTQPAMAEVVKEEEVKQEPVDKATAAKNKLANATARALEKASKMGRTNIIPEQDEEWSSILRDMFLATADMGIVKFEDAVEFVKTQLQNAGINIDLFKQEQYQAAHDGATAGLRSEARRAQEAKAEEERAKEQAEAPRREAVLDQNEKERLDRVYKFNTDRLDNVTQDEIDGYNENHEIEGLPKWNSKTDLNNAERLLYLEVNDTQGSAAAFEALRKFRKKASSSVMERTSDSNAAIYELNKAAASKEHKIEFPDWQELSPEARNAYLSTLPKLNKASPSHSGEALHTAFGKAAEQLEKENVGVRGADRLDIEKMALTEQSEQAKETYQAESEKERAAEKEAVGKGVKLSDDVVTMLQEGNINGVLRILKDTAQGVAIKGRMTITGKSGVGAFIYYLADRHRTLTSHLYKFLAAELGKLNFTSKVVTDLNNEVIQRLQQEGKLAEYDPKTDTFYFTPEGLDEATVLHEIVHAGTVKLISQFYSTPSLLTESQREAVEHLIKVYDFAKPRLVNKNNGMYSNAFENIYEFIAYALTEPKFQNELANIQARELSKFTQVKDQIGALSYKLLDQFTLAIAKLYNVVTSKGYGLYMKPYLYEALRKDRKLANKETFKIVKVSELNPAEQENHEATLLRLAEHVKTAEEKDLYNKVYTQVVEEGGLDILGNNFELDSLNKKIADRYKQEKKLQVAREKKAAAAKKAKLEKDKAEGYATVEEDEILTGRKVGSEGNALFELTEIFKTILAAPQEGIEVDPLAARRIKLPQTPPPTSREKRIDAEANALERARTGKTALTVLWGHLKAPRHAYREMVRALQSGVAPLKNKERDAEMSNTIERDETKVNLFNNSYTQQIRAIARTYKLTSMLVKPLETKITNAIIEIKKLTPEYDSQQLMNRLQLWLTGLHEPERRRWLFIKNVPLSSDVNFLISVSGIMDTPANHRDRLLAAFENLKDTPGGMSALEKADKIREELDKLIFETDPVTKKAMTGNLMSENASERVGKINKANMDKTQLKSNPNKFLENHNDQSVVGGYTAEKISDFLGELNSKNYKDKVIELFETMRELQEVTNKINVQSNFYTQANLNYIRGSGYRWYVPFKGRPELEEKTSSNGFGDDVRYSADLQFGESVAQGRESVATNPISQLIVDAKRAAYILAHQPVTQSIVNNIKQGNIKGKKVKTISHADKYKEGLKKDKSTIWLYKDNGTVEIWKVEDKAILEAVRKPYKQYSSVLAKNILDAWSKGTRLVGQGYTTFNLKFAPGNAIKDFVPNMFYIGSQYGFTPAMEYLVNTVNTVTADTVIGGGAFSAGTAMYNYQRGNWAALERKAKTDEFTKDFLQLANKDGIVTFAQGISVGNELDKLNSTIERDIKSNFNPKKASAIAYQSALIPFEYWLHMSEVSVRVSAFKTVRDHLMSIGIPEQEAIDQAATFTKELANFEHTGNGGISRGMARMYAFSRSTATGAIRFFQDLGYLLPNAESSAIEDLSDTIKNNPAALARFKQNFKEKQERTAIMTLAYLGLGMAVYSMALSGSEDDELGRNKIANDDPALWTRAIRFYLPDMKNPMQIPTGYGPGSLISIGAQGMILAQGNQTFDEYKSNVQTILQDSFSPVQMSKIPISDNPWAWAADTAAPTLMKGAVESAMNINGLGMQIVLDAGAGEPDAFRSHGNVPEIFKKTTAWLNNTSREIFDDTLIDISPNTLYHLATNGLNGVVGLLDLVEKYSMISSGEREPDITVTNPVVDALVGTPSRPDSRELIRLQQQVNEMEKRLKSEEYNPDGSINTYETRRPYDRLSIETLRREIDRLNDFRHERRVIERNMSKLPYNEKQYLLDINTRNQDLLKYDINRRLKVDNPRLRTAKDKDMNELNKD